MNTRNVLIGIIALVIIGGGLLFISSQNSNIQPQLPDITDNQPIGAGPGNVLNPNVKTFNVDAKPFEFNPKEIKVKKGDTVRIVFNNKEGFHDWVVDEFPNARTNQLQAGASQSIEFVTDKAGTFEYYCSVSGHRQKGMVGNLIVEE